MWNLIKLDFGIDPSYSMIFAWQANFCTNQAKLRKISTNEITVGRLKYGWTLFWRENLMIDNYNWTNLLEFSWNNSNFFFFFLRHMSISHWQIEWAIWQGCLFSSRCTFDGNCLTNVCAKLKNLPYLSHFHFNLLKNYPFKFE